MSLTVAQIVARYVVRLSFNAATVGFLRRSVENGRLSARGAAELLFTDGVSLVWSNERVKGYLVRRFQRVSSYPQKDMTGPHLVLIKNGLKSADCWVLGRRLAKLIYGSKVTHIVQIWDYSRGSQAMEICNPLFGVRVKDNTFKLE